MAISLILRVAILIFLFLGGLFAILATTGKKWQKYEEKENFPVCYNGPTEKTEYRIFAIQDQFLTKNILCVHLSIANQMYWRAALQVATFWVKQ